MSDVMYIPTIAVGVHQYEDQKEFYKQAEEYLSSLHIKFQQKAVIKQTMYEKIVRCLLNKHGYTLDSRFTSWCRNTFFIQNMGLKQLLCDLTLEIPSLFCTLLIFYSFIS